MASSQEGYVLHTYGPERFVRHAVASVVTLRRYDTHRPVALFCPPAHQAYLRDHHADRLFQDIETLPERYASIVGFKLHLHEFMPYERSLFVDTDIVWCRDPDPLWKQLHVYPFTATGVERADFFFGGPKNWRVIFEFFLNRRQRTMERFGITHLPRIQGGMIYAGDRMLAREVCDMAARLFMQRAATHFRSRFEEGRSEESCEWSLAMAISRYDLQVLPWLQGILSPQLDFIEEITTYDPDFREVRYRYDTDRFVYALRGIRNGALRKSLMGLARHLPGRGDYREFTPISLHFSWLHHKEPFQKFSERIWAAYTECMGATAGAINRTTGPHREDVVLASGVRSEGGHTR